MTQEGSSSRHRDFAGALKRAALAALVAFGLFSLLVGIRTDTGPGGALELTARFETLAVLVAIAFVGVFLREPKWCEYAQVNSAPSRKICAE